MSTRSALRKGLGRLTVVLSVAAGMSLGLAGPAAAIIVVGGGTVGIGNPDTSVAVDGTMEPCVAEAGIGAALLGDRVESRGFMAPCIAEDGGFQPCIAGVSIAVGRSSFQPCVVPSPGRS